MGRKFFVTIFYWDILVVVCVFCQNSRQHVAVGKFENGIQQQDFFTVLNAIEERLRNLDSVYSMQLAQTLESKLDTYSRKLETLDTKIIRLEALVMLNLDKISENISTKTFKDDIAKTNTNRKLDSLYESINNRLSYLDRKFEVGVGKIQEKLDATVEHMSKIEEGMQAGKGGTEAELEISDVVYAIDDLKGSYNVFEEKIFNLTGAMLNMSRDNFDILRRFGIDNKKSMGRLHDNIVGNLQYMDNKTNHHMKITQESNEMLKKMRTELKEDFNSYANKVADMNSDIWKNSDTTEDDLIMISTVLNATKTELQNGIRLLLVQMGKITNKSNVTDLDYFEKIDKKLSTNFEKILMNQDVFMDSCHRLQMDEAQIESEISVILEKFVDIVEKKLASETKDIKSIEKALRIHDGRTNRNIHHTNGNVNLLLEKFTANAQYMTGEIKQIENGLNGLYAFIQKSINDDVEAKNLDRKTMLDHLQNMTSSIKSLSSSKKNDEPPSQISILLTSIENELKTINNKTCCYKQPECTPQQNNTTVSQENVTLTPEVQEALNEIFGTTVNKTGQSKCGRFLLDMRSDTNQTGVDNCDDSNDNTGNSASNKTQKPVAGTKTNKCGKFLIDMRSGTYTDICDEDVNKKSTPEPENKQENINENINIIDVSNEDDVATTTVRNIKDDDAIDFVSTTTEPNNK